MSTHWKSAAAGLSIALWCGQAGAQETIKIGIISHFSGPFAMAGLQFRQGIDTFIAQHGTKVGGRQVEILYRDVGGANPATSKQLAEELIVRDKVALLGGFYLSPDASAVASVVTETKTPVVIFNAAAPPIVRQSPYFVRVSNTVWQDAVSTAEWAHMQGKQRAYVAVADFAPGYDLEAGFKWKFNALGGKIVGDDHIPLNTVDFSPFAERIASQPADIAEVFMPSGAPDISFIKALAARGLIAKETVIGLSVDTDLPKLSDAVVGYYDIGHYAPSLDTPENRAFKEALKAKFGKDAQPPNFLLAGSYDGMQVIYHMIASQEGKPFDGTAAINAVRGYAWDGPRGHVKIEADTRDITPNEYVERVEKVDGHLVNNVVYTFKAVKDPWAATHPAKP
jgi:branched-chain amino acid transport system substrate-binding protein